MRWLELPGHPFILIQRYHTFLDIFRSALPSPVLVNDSRHQYIYFLRCFPIALWYFFFVISVATYYFSKGKPTDDMHLHNNAIGHWLHTSFWPPFSMEGKPSSHVLLFWCHGAGLGWGARVLRNGGIRRRWHLSHLWLFSAYCMISMLSIRSDILPLCVLW